MKKQRKHPGISIKKLACLLNCKLTEVKDMASAYGFEIGHREFIPKKYATRVLHEMGLDEDAVQWIDISDSVSATDWTPPIYSADHEAAPVSLPSEQDQADWKDLRYYLLATYLNSEKKKTQRIPTPKIFNLNGHKPNKAATNTCRRQRTFLRAKLDELEQAEQLNGAELKRLREEIAIREEIAANTIKTPSLRTPRSIPSDFLMDDYFAARQFISDPIPIFKDAEEIQKQTRAFLLGKYDNHDFRGLQRNITMSAWLLQQLANAGDEDAASALAETLITLVTELNLFAKVYPDTYQQTARKLAQWPILYSKHNKLADDPEIIANNIKLGEASSFIIDSSARWEESDYLCQVAMKLFWHIKKVRQHPEANAHLPYSSAAGKLPDINGENAADAWWPLVKTAFLYHFPAPQYVWQLDAAITAKTHRTSPGRIRSEILARLESRFKSLFGKFGTVQKFTDFKYSTV